MIVLSPRRKVVVVAEEEVEEDVVVAVEEDVEEDVIKRSRMQLGYSQD